MDEAESIDAQIAAAFAGTKKKKKKALVGEVGADQVDQQQQQQQEAEILPFGDKKKKKKKQVQIQDFSEEQGQEEQPEEVEAVNDDQVVSSYPPMEEEQQTMDAVADFGKKKKKKKTAFADFEAQIKADEELGDDEQSGAGSSSMETKEEAWTSSNRDYTYSELLTRVFDILRAKNPEIRGEKRTYTIVPPAVSREGTKKTAFSNVLDIAKRMRRQPDHLIQFLFAELGTSGSIDGSQRLVIKGRFQPKQIESVLKKYIVEYVSCKTCKSAETILSKENRLFFVQCESCGSTRSVSAINKGFVAQLGKKPKAAE